MKQFKMVQDWGYNYLYLRHEIAITRVNLKNHSHGDVTHMPMDEFDSASSENSNSQEGDKRANLWMCGASQATMLTDGFEWRKEVENDKFIHVPYPEEKFEPFEWAHCLVAINVCTLNLGIKFFDAKGYDIVPIQMIAIVNDDQEVVKPVIEDTIASVVMHFCDDCKRKHLLSQRPYKKTPTQSPGVTNRPIQGQMEQEPSTYTKITLIGETK